MIGGSDLQKMLGSQFVFAEQNEDEEIFHQEDLLQLLPYGMSLNNDARPFLILKDAQHEFTLPVAINPLEAGVTLTQSSKSVTPVTPHKFTHLLLESLRIQALQCVFVQIKGHHQYVRIYLSGHPGTNSIKVRADEAMSLCISLNIPIFATKAFISRSKVMSAEIEVLAKGLLANPQLLNKNHAYMM